MTEINKRLCRDCKQLKDRISAGTFRNGKNKKWVDSEGGVWAGNRCNSCSNLRLKTHMQKIRTQGEPDGSQET